MFDLLVSIAEVVLIHPSAKFQKDFWSGLMFGAIGAAFAIGGTNYDFGNSVRPGPE